MNTTHKDRALAGATFLDVHHPGWENEIDLDRLSMVCQEHCVLGQLGPRNQTGASWAAYGYDSPGEFVSSSPIGGGAHMLTEMTPFAAAKFRLGLSRKRASELGFMSPPSFRNVADSYQDYNGLQEAWVEVITSRRGATVPA